MAWVRQAMRTVTILGATGSIGDSTLDVIAQHSDRFRLHALVAHRNWQKMLDLVRRFRPPVVVMVDAAAAQSLRDALAENAHGKGVSTGPSTHTEVLEGANAAIQVAEAAESDTVMAAIVGAAGLAPTLAAARAGKRVLLANKEALVMTGALFMQAVADAGATLLPIDSEHNAVFQSLPRDYARGRMARAGVRKVLLTASGGPFRETPITALANVTPEQAVAHPNWDMGRKISVDSATMMNKGLEVIEAHWLFGVPREAIEVVIHPQSVIHSMVEYVDGSVLAQLGNPDMRTPIAHALDFPARIASGVSPLDLAATGKLTFEKPDLVRFPCLQLAYDVLAAGGTASAILNAANEIAVQAFLDRQLPFMDIARVISQVLATVPSQPADSLETVLRADEAARVAAHRAIALRMAA
jgi:1-deoxy-D-xylulose-5-phosphate reductoisomerase